ncbi:MAG: topoisomerase [Caulobacter sp.]|nr:topoisomerase [Caulobacter sp.]
MARDSLESPVAAEEAGLIYVHEDDPGIRRVKSGKGFAYKDAHDRAVKDDKTLDRIAKLVIPPAWSDVWIAASARGHIQATGRDQRGRKQYRYHDKWRATRDEHKYGRVAAFGHALPRLRRQVEADLARRGLPREKVLAAVVRLLEVTLIRVGNDEYAKTNKSFGLTTLQKRHVKVSGAGAVFEFKGKSGKMHKTGFQDRRLVRIVKACQELRGQRLFKYRDEGGELRPVESADINDYLRAATGQDFTAKDFRTWAGTVSAARALAMQAAPSSETEARRAVATCIKAVSGLLGNTPAVCRAAYVHPAVLDAFAKAELDFKTTGSPRGFETALIRFLETDRG